MAKFIIEVRSKGFEKATRDFDKLNQSSKTYDNTQNKLRGSTSGFRRQLGALRNNLLLLTFAFVGVSKGIGGFVRAASGFQDVQTRLVGLTGSTERAKEAFAAFNQVAATTPFQLQDVVNAGAQLEAFGLNSKLTLSATTDLAAFMGTNAVEAASALGRAFAGGAGAADILRERGILQLIKDSQGIEDLSKLTLPQFRQALLKAMVDPVSGIQGSSKRLSETFTGSVSNMRDAITRFQALIGNVMLPSLTKMVKATEQFFRSIDLQTLAQFATSVGVATTALALYQARAIGAAVVTAALSLNWKKFLGAVTLGGIALITDHILKMKNAFSGLSNQVTASTSAQINQNLATKQYIQQLGQSNKVLEQSLELRKAMEELTRTTFLLHIENEGIDEKRLKTIKMMFDAENLLKQALGDRISVNREAILTGQAFATIGQDLTDQEIAFVSMVERLVIEQKRRIEVDKEAIDTNQILARSFDTVSGAVRQLRNGTADSEQELKLFIQTAASLIALIAGPKGKVASGVLNLGAAFIGHTGGLVKNNGIQRFAHGGMVQGQDNVPIMAQAGEFIIRREAVQNIGVQNLAQMNRSGSGGGITVNIQGNMVGNESFVRDTLIPEISKAQKLNLA